MRKFGGLAGATSQPPTNAPHGARFSSLLGPHVPAWVHTCADYYAAAALYSNYTAVRMPNFVGWDCRASTSGRSFARHAIELHTQVRARGQKMVSKALFEQLVLPHMPAAFNLAYWIVRSRDEAEDVVQDA